MKKIILVFVLIFIGCNSPPTQTIHEIVYDTIYYHDTIIIVDTTGNDTAGQGQSMQLVLSKLNTQFSEDSLNFFNESKKIRQGSGATYTAYANAVIAIVNTSANNSLSYIQQIARTNPINRTAIIDLLNNQCSREISEAIKYVDGISSIINQITVAFNNKYAQIILSITAL